MQKSNSLNNSSYYSVNLFTISASNHTNKCELKEDRISLNEEEYGLKNEVWTGQSSNNNKCELEEDEISLNEKEYSTKSKVWTATIVVGQNYNTKKDILNIAQKNTKNFGFAVSTKSSSSHHLYIQCKCAILNNSKWRVAEIINEHNHPIVKDLLFVNFVGISNLGINYLYTFGITGAWISDESEKSYIWIIEHLTSLIFFNIFPSVFVTDNDLALIGALGKHFSNILFDEVVKVIDNFIYSRDCDALNAVITTNKKLDLSSSNESEVLKYLD
ncbi:1591_t:CDS:2, partial [Cetraspora pellucida]